MTRSASARGAATVGMLSDLPPLEAGAVLYMRLWFSGPETRAEMRADFEDLLGADLAEVALDTFEQLCTLCVTQGRRPLMRHGLQCNCLGADENCFANLIASAADGQNEDATLLASLLVRPSAARHVTPLACEFGHVLRQMTETLPPHPAHRPTSITLH